MARDVMTSTRRTVITGVAGMLAVALGATAVMGPSINANAALVPASEPTVANAVAEAEATRAAQEAARFAQRQAVVDLAGEQVGDGYRRGGSGPNVFDCSGLVMWVNQQALGVSLPHHTRGQWNAIEDTWRAGERAPQPGDVVFFFNGADHVGIYVGDGMMVHAANPRSGVRVDPIYEGYWAGRLTGFGRTVQ